MTVSELKIRMALTMNQVSLLQIKGQSLMVGSDIVYVSVLPGGDGVMPHSVYFVIIRRMAISDTLVSIC